MVRVVLYIISGFGFVAGIVGWITLPDDALLWSERLGPVFAGMSKDDLIIILFGISALGVALLVFSPKLHSVMHRVGTTAINVGRALVMRTESPMSFVFPCNQDCDKSDQRNQKFVGIFQEDGGPIVAIKVVWRIGVMNTFPDKTIKNAIVRVTTMNGRSFPLRASDAEDEFYADIHPYRTAYFDIGFFTIAPPNDIKRIMDSAEPVPKIVADRIRSEKSTSLSFFPQKKASFAPVENVDKSTINVDVYADDVQPIHATIMCCLQDNPRMFMV